MQFFPLKFPLVIFSKQKEEVYNNVVQKCEGCLLPRDIERETEMFGFSTKLTLDEISVLADDLSNKSYICEYAIDDNELRDMITDRMRAIDPRYNCVIQIDKKD